MDNRDKVIERTTDRLRELTINELFEENANATGQLAQSIKYVPIKSEGNTAIALEMEDYGFILDSGRGGAKKADGQSWQPNLVQWIKAKGIKPKPGVTIEQLSYAIYNSINRKGYKAKPFVEQAIAAYDAVFADEYAEATANDIEVDLEKIK
jgi:hypothetical protein